MPSDSRDSLESIADLASALVRCRTTADRPGEMWRSLQVVQLWWEEALPPPLARATLSVWGQEGRDVPLAFLHPPGDPRPPLLLHAHLDVVPAPDDAFAPRRSGDRLHGRGTADMKGAAAVMLHLAAEVLPRGHGVGVLLTYNEEAGGRAGSGLGTERFLDDLGGYRPEFFLSGERSGLRVAHRSKGMLRLEATVRGRAAHAATPWEGDNALVTMALGAERLSRLAAEPDGATLALTSAAAGGAMNVVPDVARLGMDARFVTAAERAGILAAVREALPGASLELLLDEPGASCDPEHPWLGRLLAALRAEDCEPALFTKPHASDVRLANERGIPGVVFGPEGDGVHGDVEWVSLPSLAVYRNVLRRLATG